MMHIEPSGRPVPEEYQPEIVYISTKVVAHPPGMPRFAFQVRRNNGISDADAEISLTRVCWQVTCLSEAGRLAEIDGIWRPGEVVG